MRTTIWITCIALVAATTAAAQVPGGFREADVKSKEVVAAAEAAVKAQRLSEKGKLDLAAVLKAESQVVAGVNYKLKLLLAVDGGTREADAVVWSKLDRTYQLSSWKWLGEVKADKK